ncbi:MAG: SDR family NAD(P)-dependent oxidoreductase [Luminiphilus sp.]|nr:SDR family NAD(P)-dependent oxidoreductase [Luminiphilus sp.]MDG1461003.1 SDR family NAD(P)-dependent oxidoreductase [Luminiphilus sp.]
MHRKAAVIFGVGPREGVGAELCFRAAREGFHVFVNGRSSEKLSAIVASIVAEGGSAEPLLADVTVENQIIVAMNQVASSGYPLELAIYNAGNNRPEAFLDVTPAVFEDLWRVTCLGGFIVSQQVIKLMLQQQKIAKKQTLLFTGASASLRGKAGFSGFAAGKGALRMLTQSIAREFAPQGIHVAHVLIDGVVEGEKVRTGFPEYINSLGEDGALKLGEIADAYMALHAQGRSAWTQELDLRPYKESY